MLKKIRKLLGGPLPTVEQIDKTTASIVIPALEAALAAAEKRRTESLLDESTIDEILAFEKAVDTARIELERGRVALVELERRRAEAAAAATRTELERKRTDAQALVDGAVKRIEAEYPKHAAAIAELAELAKEADAAAREWLKIVIGDNPPEGLDTVDPVAVRLGWHGEFFCPPDFADGPSLPPVGDFCGFRDDAFVTHTRHYAVVGAGTGGEMVRAQQENGPRWGRI